MAWRDGMRKLSSELCSEVGAADLAYERLLNQLTKKPQVVDQAHHEPGQKDAALQRSGRQSSAQAASGDSARLQGLGRPVASPLRYGLVEGAREGI